MPMVTPVLPQHGVLPKPKRRRRHIPHSDRPIDAVRKRNERERKRVDDVNSAFVDLQLHLPSDGRPRRRLSKIKVLQTAIDYIDQLSSTLNLSAYSGGKDIAPPCTHVQTMAGSTFWAADIQTSSADSGSSGLSGESFDGEQEFLQRCQKQVGCL